jgi:HAD superfamily hydrolase (TIGR01509 family)
MKAVIFDVFGTLLQIGRYLDPFNALSRMAIQQGIQVPRTALHQFMCHPWSLADCAEHLHFKIPAREMRQLERQLEDHLASVRPFDEVTQVMEALRARGFKIALCSNLAQPYGDTVRAMLPGMDAYVLSYEVGTTKPDPSIYQLALSALGVDAGATIMVGDSKRCDKRGPESIGINSYWLNRDGLKGAECHSLLDLIPLLS